jgi:hypothetical protein
MACFERQARQNDHYVWTTMKAGLRELLKPIEAE